MNKTIQQSDYYQEKAIEFRTPTCDNLAYPLFGLYEETAELMEKTRLAYTNGWSGILSRIVVKILIWQGKLLGKWAKRIRKDKSPVPFIPVLTSENNLHEQRKELGDIHWMVVNLDDVYYSRTSEINTLNIAKLRYRQNTDTIITHKDH